MISENLKKIRGFRGVSKSTLAEATGLNPVTIWKIEAGKSDPSVKTLEKLAHALNVDVALFFAASLIFTKDISKAASS